MVILASQTTKDLKLLFFFQGKWCQAQKLFLVRISEFAQNRRTVRNFTEVGAAGWISQLSILLQLRSWFCGLWVQAPHQGLCWQLRAGVCFRFCVSLSASLLPVLCLCFSQKTKNKKQKTKTLIKKKLYWSKKCSCFFSSLNPIHLLLKHLKYLLLSVHQSNQHNINTVG